MHEDLLARGAALSYPALTAFCRKHGIGSPPAPPAGHYEFSVGQEMQHDTSPHWATVGGQSVKVQIASLVLCYSRMIFFQVYPRFTRFECKALLTETLSYLGPRIGPRMEYIEGRNYGGARRDRTADLLHAMQALSQLSYGPTTEGGEGTEGTPRCQAVNEAATRQRDATHSLTRSGSSTQGSIRRVAKALGGVSRRRRCAAPNPYAQAPAHARAAAVWRRSAARPPCR